MIYFQFTHEQQLIQLELQPRNQSMQLFEFILSKPCVFASEKTYFVYCSKTTSTQKIFGVPHKILCFLHDYLDLMYVQPSNRRKSVKQ